jgi:uncharacterized protein YjbI with pentapeptide repeats
MNLHSLSGNQECFYYYNLRNAFVTFSNLKSIQDLRITADLSKCDLIKNFECDYAFKHFVLQHSTVDSSSLSPCLRPLQGLHSVTFFQIDLTLWDKANAELFKKA